MTDIYAPKFCCIECDYFTTVKSNLQKHLKTSKHLLKITPEDKGIILTKNHCKLCHKCYKSQSGLWRHSKVCNVKISVVENVDLHKKIDNLERVIDKLTVLVQNQQPTTINNNIRNK